MAAATRPGGTLKATLCEIERGVFYATYADQEAVSHLEELTNYQIANSAADAKRNIELSAYALGYDDVMWTETIVAPLFAPQAARAALHQSATRHRA